MTARSSRCWAVLGMTPTDPDSPVTGNLAEGLAGLLAAAGVTTTAVRDSIEVRVQAILGQLGLRAEMADLRWGTLRLDTDPQTAHLLRYAADQILAGHVDYAEVAKVAIRVKRAAASGDGVWQAWNPSDVATGDQVGTACGRDFPATGRGEFMGMRERVCLLVPQVSALPVRCAEPGLSAGRRPSGCCPGVDPGGLRRGPAARRCSTPGRAGGCPRSVLPGQDARKGGAQRGVAAQLIVGCGNRGNPDGNPGRGCRRRAGC